MRRAARVDLTAKALTAEAKRLGAQVLTLNGVIDAVLLLPDGRVELCDWKSPGGTLTDEQAKLTAQGWPVRYLSTVDQLRRLVHGRAGGVE